jgi:hypothetical protein
MCYQIGRNRKEVRMPTVVTITTTELDDGSGKTQVSIDVQGVRYVTKAEGNAAEIHMAVIASITKHLQERPSEATDVIRALVYPELVREAATEIAAAIDRMVDAREE